MDNNYSVQKSFDNDKELPSLNDKNNLLGLILIIFPLILLGVFLWLPILKVFKMSFFDPNGLTDGKFMGVQNYVEMISDDSFWKALFNTFKINFLFPNVFIISIIPLAIAFLIAKLKGAGDIITRVLASLLIFLSSSVLLSMICRRFFSENYPKLIISTDYSIFGLGLSELIIGICIFVPIFTVIYLASLKGADFNLSNKTIYTSIWSNLWRIYIIVFIIISAISLQSVNTSFLVTNGGPYKETETLILKIYNDCFTMGRFGYAAAEQVVLIIALLLAGGMLWFALEKSGIKFWVSTEKSDTGSKFKNKPYLITLIISIIIVLVLLALVLIIIVFPFVSTFIDGLDGYKSGFIMDNKFISGLLHTVGILIPILLIQLFISLLGGFALGRFRFPGRKIIFLFVCLTVFITPQLMLPQIALIYFKDLKEMHLGDTPFPLIFSLIGNTVGIILFKLYFEGYRIEISRMNMTTDIAVKNKIRFGMILNTIWMSVFVMVMYAMLFLNDFLTQSVVIRKESMATLNLLNIELVKTYTSESSTIMFAFLSFIPVIIVGMVFILLQIFFFPKLKIIRQK